MLRIFGGLGLGIALAGFIGPLLAPHGVLTAQDIQKFWSLAGAVGGVALVLLIASFLTAKSNH